MCVCLCLCVPINVYVSVCLRVILDVALLEWHFISCLDIIKNRQTKQGVRCLLANGHPGTTPMDQIDLRENGQDWINHRFCGFIQKEESTTLFFL